MSGNDVSDGPHRNGIAAGRTSTHPSFGGQVAEERHAGLADVPELLDVPRPGNSI